LTPRKPLPHDQRGPKDSFWTKERDAKLRQLVAEGLGDTAIARILGCTRKAIVGKRQRSNIQGNDERKKRKVTAARKWKANVAQGPQPPRPPPPRVFADEPKPALMPDGKPITIRNCPWDCCRFIAGDDPMGPMCGHPAKGSYCDWHRANRLRPRPAA
jgi:hypothetical protein